MPKRSRSPVDTNKNTEWLHSHAMKVLYVAVLFLAWLTLTLFFPHPPESWTATLVTHSVVSFFLLHWTKGLPFDGFYNAADDASSSVDDLTFWEQIDNTKQNTPTRKFYAVVPFILFFITIWYTQEDLLLLALNFAATLLVVVPKFPTLFRVRLFGLNR
eukprot:TRINITY_DN6957_c1_g1_i2.p2 TRINITY_DN6957_c1_g1~~TRINITY_DN6957_c1_g1_i2.p2  ORF type:complete len:171 (-),score=23.96 TRINITY_DN6957_c1_g1_i2:1958-2434(-)